MSGWLGYIFIVSGGLEIAEHDEELKWYLPANRCRIEIHEGCWMTEQKQLLLRFEALTFRNG